MLRKQKKMVLDGLASFVCFADIIFFFVMAAFKKHYNDIGKDTNAPMWTGTVYQCKVLVMKPGTCVIIEVCLAMLRSGFSAMQPCGVKVPAKNSNTTGLRQHIRDRHPEEYRETVQQASTIQHFSPGTKDGVQHENIALAFAENALPYQVPRSTQCLAFIVFHLPAYRQPLLSSCIWRPDSTELPKA